MTGPAGSWAWIGPAAVLAAGLAAGLACAGDARAPAPFVDSPDSGGASDSGPPDPPDPADPSGGDGDDDIRLDLPPPDDDPDDEGPPPFESYGALGQLVVWMGRPDGTWAEPRAHVVGHDPHTLAVGDVDGDGRLDAVVTVPGDAAIVTLVGAGDGGFRTTEVEEPGERTQVLLVDFDDDGRIDRLVLGIRWLQNWHDWYKGQTLRLARGADGGGFEAELEIEMPVETLGRVVPVDLNTDGRLDLYVEQGLEGAGCFGNQSWSVLQGDDAMDLVPIASTRGAFWPRPVVPADVNLDDYPDILSADQQVGIAENDGTGALEGVGQLPLVDGAWSAMVADVAGDGGTDLVFGISCPCGHLDTDWALQIHPRLEGRYGAPEFRGLPTLPRLLVGARGPMGETREIVVAGELEEDTTPIATPDRVVARIPGHVRDLALADLDADGSPDILALTVPPHASPRPAFYDHMGDTPAFPCPE